MMWLLLLVLFSGPMQIERMEIIGTHWNEKMCIDGANHAKEVGIPNNANVGCIRVKGVKQVRDVG